MPMEESTKKQKLWKPKDPHDWVWKIIAGLVLIVSSALVALIFNALSNKDSSDQDKPTIQNDSHTLVDSVDEQQSRSSGSSTRNPLGINRLAPSYLEITGELPVVTDIDNVESLGMTMVEFLEEGQLARENGNFSDLEYFKLKVSGKWVEWIGSVFVVESGGSMAWDFMAQVYPSSESYRNTTIYLLFYGKDWGNRVLSLRENDRIKFTGRIHQSTSGGTVSVNIYDYEKILSQTK